VEPMKETGISLCERPRVRHEIHQDQIPNDWRFEVYMHNVRSSFPNVERVNDFEYLNHRQRVHFTIQETTDKAVFKQWLEAPELHVIYNGHARYGRGPCFGRGEYDTKSEDWEQGTNAATKGLFRVGFPFIGIAAHEIFDHGYTANLLRLPGESRRAVIAIRSCVRLSNRWKRGRRNRSIRD
jgi:hypothetical protein